MQALQRFCKCPLSDTDHLTSKGGGPGENILQTNELKKDMLQLRVPELSFVFSKQIELLQLRS